MAHGALSRVGRMLNGPDALIGALLDATSPGGTVLAYTDWDARYDQLLEPDGRVRLSTSASIAWASDSPDRPETGSGGGGEEDATRTPRGRHGDASVVRI